jgi:hypothetical protein
MEHTFIRIGEGMIEMSEAKHYRIPSEISGSPPSTLFPKHTADIPKSRM